MFPDKWEDRAIAITTDMPGTAKNSKWKKQMIIHALYLVLGRIDDADEVYLNGKLIGKSGNFPPEYITAYNKVRRYNIPQGILKNGEYCKYRCC